MPFQTNSIERKLFFSCAIDGMLQGLRDVHTLWTSFVQQLVVNILQECIDDRDHGKFLRVFPLHRMVQKLVHGMD